MALRREAVRAGGGAAQEAPGLSGHRARTVPSGRRPAAGGRSRAAEAGPCGPAPAASPSWAPPVGRHRRSPRGLRGAEGSGGIGPGRAGSAPPGPGSPPYPRYSPSGGPAGGPRGGVRRSAAASSRRMRRKARAPGSTGPAGTATSIFPRRHLSGAAPPAPHRPALRAEAPRCARGRREGGSSSECACAPGAHERLRASPPASSAQGGPWRRGGGTARCGPAVSPCRQPLPSHPALTPALTPCPTLPRSSPRAGRTTLGPVGRSGPLSPGSAGHQELPTPRPGVAGPHAVPATPGSAGPGSRTLNGQGRPETVPEGEGPPPVLPLLPQPSHPLGLLAGVGGRSSGSTEGPGKAGKAPPGAAKRSRCLVPCLPLPASPARGCRLGHSGWRWKCSTDGGSSGRLRGDVGHVRCLGD